jgi:orotidine-5'-phosphate decarboxylase
VFVLALTSNPEAPAVQHARTPDGHTVAGGVLAGLAALNAGVSPMGSFGAVVGATIGETAEDLDVNGPLLVPGVGAQGGSPDTVRRIFSGVLPNVLPASSREILGAGPAPAGLRAAAEATTQAFVSLLAERP